ncbi:TetR family transcriptional regulator C-terminal domain-containing protein [Leifsonia sp. YIM 134122]|uniref:TetR family transcriptional regulator C-terminal domain-containing protein n=1 Tax=Leifsonia stereocauli TaxID=3134136 RepID=A0ABU9VZ59_9MICO
MVTVELPVVASRTSPASAQEFIDGLVDLYGFLTGSNREMTAARLALFVEASHDDELRALLAEGRSRLLTTLRSQFVALGAPDPDLATQLLAVCFEGLFLHDIAGHDDIDARSVLDAIVRASLR